jgi:Histone deacetylase domain
MAKFVARSRTLSCMLDLSRGRAPHCSFKAASVMLLGRIRTCTYAYAFAMPAVKQALRPGMQTLTSARQPLHRHSRPSGSCTSAAGSPATNPSNPVFFYSDHYEYPLPKGHRFPMDKYRLVREQLERDPKLSHVKFSGAPLASREDLELVHDPAYIARFLIGELTKAEERESGFPWTLAGATRALGSTGGTIAATRALLDSPGMRIAGATAGGTHHAFADRPNGFCLFNDIAGKRSQLLRFLDYLRY